MRRIRYSAALVLAGIILATSSARSAEIKVLDTFKDWTAYVMGTGQSAVCFISSVPKKAEGNYTRRGDIIAYVTNRKADNVRGEVSFEAGYTYKKNSTVKLAIGSQTFELFTSDGNAWARQGGDVKLVKAMKAGSKMVVRGTSSRGTATKDTYSLLGFTKAINAINKACS